MDEPIDQDAITIGRLYASAQTLAENRIFYFGDAGDRLLKKKESLGHGHWLRWISANEEALGFGNRVARSLIQGAQWLASNWQIATKLEEVLTDPHASEQDLADAREIRDLIAGQFQPTVQGTFGRRQNEWYTPAKYISLARRVLGEIDVDPASNKFAQEIVRARQYFDKQQNGLLQSWYGRVWLNPPYSPPLIGKFIGKLLQEWNARRTEACIALTHNCTDSMWFHDAASAANAICFTCGRVRFYESDGAIGAKTHRGQAFFYFGSEIETFKREFERIGFIVRPEPDNPWTRLNVRAYETQAN